MVRREWVEMYLENQTPDVTIEIKNVSNEKGKLYRPGNSTGNEISTSDIEGKTIDPQQAYAFGHCSPSIQVIGFGGSFELYERGNPGRICKVVWDSPHWSGDNTFRIDDCVAAFKVTAKGANLFAEAIGSVQISISK